MANGLNTSDAADLMVEPDKEFRWFVKDLLTVGCFILAAKPKLGKSFLCLQLGVALVSGQTFVGTFETDPCGVCLLMMEDGKQRAKRRLWQITDEVERGLRIGESVERIDQGFFSQLETDIAQNPDTGVYVVDTLASIRPPGADFNYQDDYDLSSSVTQFAIEHGICIILVHHCRKAVGFGDAFDDIAGTHGLTAGATGMIVLQPDQRDKGKVLMSSRTKDAEESAWRIELESGRWHLVESLSKHEITSYSVPDCVLATIEWADTRVDAWSGTTSELFNEVGVCGVSLNAYGKYLAQHAQFMRSSGIQYTHRRTRIGSVVTLARIDAADDDR